MPTLEFTPVVIAHTAAALGALVLGTSVMVGRKGTTLHRYAGRTWMLLMVLTALSSFGIRGSGQFSWIHLLSITALFAVYFAIHFARSGKIQRHRRVVQGLFFGGLVIAGVFTLLPQRLLGQALWQSLGFI